MHKERQMKLLMKTVLLLGCMLWPAAADLSDYKPKFEYALPADIMRVDFAHESWTYRLFEDGSIKKLVHKKTVTKNIFAVNDDTTQDGVSPKDHVTG